MIPQIHIVGDISIMPLSERVYFLGEPAAHVVARDEHLRLVRIQRECRLMVRGLPRFLGIFS